MTNISKASPQRPRIDNSVWHWNWTFYEDLKAMIEMDVANSDEGYLKHPNEVGHNISQYLDIWFWKDCHKYFFRYNYQIIINHNHSSLCLRSTFLANIKVDCLIDQVGGCHYATYPPTYLHYT